MGVLSIKSGGDDVLAVPHGTEQVVCTNVQNAKKVQVDTRKVISNG